VMPTLSSERGTIEIVPVVKGLVSESPKVGILLDGGYDAAAASLGPEDISAIGARSELGEAEISDADAVYGHFLSSFGKIGSPSPVYCALVDLCAEKGIPLIPADMDDAEYTEAYCRNISLLETLKERSLIRSAAKGGLDMSSPEAFAKDFENSFRRIRGFNALAHERADRMAGKLYEALDRRKRIAAFIEIETADDIARILMESYGMRQM